MPFELKPLFRPDVVYAAMQVAPPPPVTEPALARLRFWRDRLDGDGKRGVGEASHLADFIADVFGGVLGYRSDVDSPAAFTIARERVNPVDGKCADAIIGRFTPDGLLRPVMVVEGKGPLDPLERAHGGRRQSAVEQAYLYAVNQRCDWIVVTNMVETRLYNKRADQRTCEIFETKRLANEPHELARFVFLLGVDSVLPSAGDCRPDALLAESERQGRELSAQFYDDYQQIRLTLLDTLRTHNPALPPERALGATQKLLDRVLFAAFCEDRGLLPADIVERAIDTVNPFNPTPRWDNFKSLFRAIDAGNATLNISLYNGGLFAPDPELDGLILPDAACENFRRLAAYNFRAAAPSSVPDGAAAAPVVDVDILGHIFEQSIDDLDRLRGELISGEYEEKRRRQAKGGRGPSRRNLGGSFYTPAFVTRYMAAEALAPVLVERFAACQAQALAEAAAAAGGKGGKALAAIRAVLDNPRAVDTDPRAISPGQRAHLVKFWESWRQELQTIRILDPACGSGAFLIECFEQLAAAYRETNARLADLSGGQYALFDADAAILRNNLFGVDISREAVNICRLSLWIKTAKRNTPLTDLDHNVIQGDSVVDDPAANPAAVDFAARFPAVFAPAADGGVGGFDVVIGNPPYVRHELIQAHKPFLERRYASYHGMADLYVYFYERGVELLRPGGRLSYVVTNKWLRAGYGENLRRFFAERAWVESVVDFGHAKQFFPDADVFPCVILARRPLADAPAPAEARICAIPRDALRIDDLARQTADEGFNLPRAGLDAAPWRLEPPAVLALMDKIRSNGTPLAEYAGVKPLYGVKTGLNEAFLIDGPTRDRLVREDPGCAALIKPYLRGQDVKRWAAPSSGLYMIVMKSSGDHPWPWAEAGERAETIFAAAYPGLHRWFKPWEDRLRKRQDKGRYWWELRPCAYYKKFSEAKIVYQTIQFYSSYFLDNNENYGNDKTFMIPTSDAWVLAVLNSPLIWWRNWRVMTHLKDEALSPLGYMMEMLPIAKPSDEARAAAAIAVDRLTAIHGEKHETAAAWADWLKLQHGVDKPGRALAQPFNLSVDDAAAAVKAACGPRRPLSVAALRELKKQYAAVVSPVQSLLEEADRLERQLSGLVNQAFGLTAEEEALMWRTAPPRMPLGPDATDGVIDEDDGDIY